MHNMIFCDVSAFYDDVLMFWRWHVSFNKDTNVLSDVEFEYDNVSLALDGALSYVDVLGGPSCIVRSCKTFYTYDAFETHVSAI